MEAFYSNSRCLCIQWNPSIPTQDASVYSGTPSIPTQGALVYSGSLLFQLKMPLYTVEPLYSNSRFLCIQWNPSIPTQDASVYSGTPLFQLKMPLYSGTPLFQLKMPLYTVEPLYSNSRCLCIQWNSSRPFYFSLLFTRFSLKTRLLFLCI